MTCGLPFVARLREALDSNLDQLTTLERAAQHLAVSTRTLQRRLREGQTTFRKERALCRFRGAERLLSGSEISVSRVALAVGFSTSQSLSRQFSQLSGKAPSRFRAQTSQRSRELAAENLARGETRARRAPSKSS